MKPLAKDIVPQASWALVHIITKMEIGGAQFATLDSLSKSALAFKDRILITGPGGRLDTKIREFHQGHTFFSSCLRKEIHPLMDLLAIFQIAGLLKKYKREHPKTKILVHTHCSKAGIIGRLAAFLARTELIIHTVHGYGYHRYPQRYLRPFFKFSERLCAQFTDAFSVDAKANKQQGVSDHLFSKAPVKVIYCGVNADAFGNGPAAKIREELNLGPDHHVVIHITNFKEQKNPKLFIKVAHRLCDLNPQIRFIVTGEDSLRSECEAYAKAHGFYEHIRFVGWRKDIPQLMRASNMLLNTSSWEGLPQAFPQALLSGIPIVATHIDGASEIIRDQVNGSLCPPGEVDSLVQETLSWLSKGKLDKKDLVKNIEPFLNTYTTQQIDELYLEMMD